MIREAGDDLSLTETCIRHAGISTALLKSRQGIKNGDGREEGINRWG